MKKNMEVEFITKVKSFWDWFVQNLDILEQIDENDNSLIDEIDRRVSELGDFSWEIGPGQNKKNSFIISPSGVLESLQLTKKIEELAPNVDGWEFYSSKPPKDWDYIFSFVDGQNNEIHVDAKEWEYILLKYNDNRSFDLILKGPFDLKTDEESSYIAAEILIIGTIGEDDYITRIESVEIVNSFERNLIGKQTNIRMLKKHLQSLVGNAPVPPDMKP